MSGLRVKSKEGFKNWACWLSVGIEYVRPCPHIEMLSDYVNRYRRLQPIMEMERWIFTYCLFIFLTSLSLKGKSREVHQ